MLPSIDLQLTDISALNSESVTAAKNLPDTDSPAEDFAGLLYQPLPVLASGISPDKGQGLPDVGNLLPLEGDTSTPVADLIAQFPDVGYTASPSLAPAEVFETHTPTMNEMSLVLAASPLSPSAQMQSPAQAKMPAQLPLPVQMQTADELQAAARLQASSQSQATSHLQAATQPQVQTQAPVLTADSLAQRLQAASIAARGDILQPKPATGDSTSTINEAQMRRATGPATNMLRTKAPDNIDIPVRPMSAPDLNAISEGRPSISASFPSLPAGMADRLQMSPQGQSFDPAPLTVGPTAPQVSASQVAPAASTPATPTPPGPIDIPLRDPAWGDALGDRVLFMSGQKIHQAEIRLNPAEMGPISIRVSVDDGAADVIFTAQHLAAREAIELAMPRLRELLSENGLVLGNTSVSEQGVEQDKKGSEAQEAMEQNSADARESSPDDDVQRQTPTRRGQGLVDTFV